MQRNPNRALDPNRFSRRRFIRTAGVTITLPMLPSLLHTPGSFAQAACGAPRRFIAYMFPNGHKLDEHVPSGTGTGAAWSLPPMLESWQDLKPHLLFVSGLENQQRRAEFGDHAIGCGSLLTARKPTKNQKLTNSSIDQVIADAIGGCNGVPSLQLGTHNAGPSDAFGTDYTRSISWRGPMMEGGNGTVSYPAGAATPLGKEINPQRAFDRLFAGIDPEQSNADAEMRLALRKSVLDTVKAEGSTLLSRLNAEDRLKVDELFTGIRSLENELQSQGAPGACAAPDRPTVDGDGDFRTKLTQMHELMAVALQCDLTRVITFMMGDAQNNRSLGFIPEVAALGGDAGDHGVSHESTPKFRAMVVWKMEQIAGFVRRLSMLQDADGQSVLDNSLVWVSSELSDGRRHNHDDYPILMAGKLGGLVSTDRHLRYPFRARDYAGMKTFGDFFINLANLFGVTMTTFGDDGKEAIAWHA